MAEKLIKRKQREGLLVGLYAGVWLTAAAGGSQAIRFERFTYQASTSGGGTYNTPQNLDQRLRWIRCLSARRIQETNDGEQA
jgi:hypothetical protein